jgi:hypothetical protein
VVSTGTGGLYVDFVEAVGDREREENADST